MTSIPPTAAPPSPDPQTRAALEAGVMTTATALLMHTRAEIRAQLKARRWQQPARSVVVTHNGPLTATQQHWVVLLAAPAGSALGGLTAATKDGFHSQLVIPRPVLVVPHKARRPHVDADITYSRHLGDEDVHPCRTPRRTRLPRSLLDAASDRRDVRTARAIILSGVQQRLVSPAQYAESLIRRPACRHHAVIAESIVDAAGGIHSVPEKEFDGIRVRWHLPEPTRQRIMRRRDGSYYLDVDWRRYRLSCEIHGRPHMEVVQWDDDLDRANEITIGGPHMLFFTSYAVRHLQARVGDQLTRALINGGWRP